MECIQKSGGHQTEYVGGICTDDGVKFAIPIPDLDSFLVGFSADTHVVGLEDIPVDERPPANTLLHLAFDTMVGIGSALLLLGIWVGWVWWKKRDIPQTKWFLRAVSVSGAGAILALWCGWIVTEVGRQPWIVQGYMRTEEAVTEADGIWFTFGVVLILYAALGTAAVLVLRGMSRRWREAGSSEDVESPYGPAGTKRVGA
jgi:cytochrome d ubiquinol oxidase subunit I